MASTKKNITLAVTQSILNACTLFLAYKFILLYQNLDMLGLWSLVVSIASFARLSELGMAGSATKFISKYRSLNQQNNIVKVLQTATTLVLPFVIVFTLLIYYPAKIVLARMLEGENLSIGLEMLPVALVSAALATLSNLYCFSLDGMQRVDLRAKLIMFCLIMYLIGILVLVPNFGVIGVVYARLIQSLCLLLLSIYSIHRVIPGMSFLPFGWDNTVFKEIIGYGVKMQATGVAVFLFEPLTKLLFGIYADLKFLALFEMANKIVLQARSLGIAANQALVPRFAENSELKQAKVKTQAYTFKVNQKVALGVSIVTCISIIACSPILSLIMLNTIEPTFLTTITVCCVSWLVNSFSQAAYFSNLGTGTLNGNLLGHLVVIVSNILLGFGLGNFFGFLGVFVAWSVSVALGSFTTMTFFARTNQLKSHEFININQINSMLIGSLGLTISAVFLFRSGYNIITFEDGVIAAFISMIAIAVSIKILVIDFSKFTRVFDDD